jgi:enoyl-CoA hydratase/carnithine racemase
VNSSDTDRGTDSGPQDRPGDGLLYQAADGIAVVTINRPHRGNAIAPETATALHALVQRIEADETVRAAVLAASGGRIFCAGSDLKAKSEGAAPAVTQWGFGGFVKAPRAKPFVAAVSGVAVGGGFELVLACDLAVAAQNAEFGLPEVRRGLVAGGGGLIRLPRLLPTAVANEVLLAGRMLSAAEARAYGLVNRVVPGAEVLAAAVDLARSCTLGAPVAVRETLAVARMATGADDAALWRRSDQASATAAATADGKEGPRAFAEKRPAVWQNR